MTITGRAGEKDVTGHVLTQDLFNKLSKGCAIDMNRYEIMERKVKAGNSEVFREWSELARVSPEEFLEALKWVCEDPENGGRTGNRITREIALTPNGITRLRVEYGIDDISALYDEDGKFWGGATFRVPCDKPDFADEDGMIPQTFKLCLNCRDRI